MIMKAQQTRELRKVAINAIILKVSEGNIKELFFVLFYFVVLDVQRLGETDPVKTNWEKE